MERPKPPSEQPRDPFMEMRVSVPETPIRQTGPLGEVENLQGVKMPDAHIRTPEEEEPIESGEFDEGGSQNDDEQYESAEDVTRLSFGTTDNNSSAQVFIEDSDRKRMDPIAIAPQDLEEVGEEGGAVENLINVPLPEIVPEPTNEAIPMEEEKDEPHAATSENPETIARSSFLPGQMGTRTQELRDGSTDKPPKTDDEAEEPIEAAEDIETAKNPKALDEQPEQPPSFASHSGIPRGARMKAQQLPPTPPSIAM